MPDEAIVGTHPVVRALRRALEALAHAPVSVAISGEPGTGKDLFASTLHHAGGGDDLQRIDCSDDPTRLEARFGRLFAELGSQPLTLLLDQLPMLPLDLQGQMSAHLAQLCGRQGRIVVSLHAPLTDERRRGRLSGALLRQLQPMIEIQIPALRERRADIPLLVEHFLARYGAHHECPPCRVENDALVRLWQYDWPGNIRELEAVLERAVVLCRDGVIRARNLPPHVAGSGPASTLGDTRGRSAVPRALPPALRPQL